MGLTVGLPEGEIDTVGDALIDGATVGKSVGGAVI